MYVTVCLSVRDLSEDENEKEKAPGLLLPQQRRSWARVQGEIDLAVGQTFEGWAFELKDASRCIGVVAIGDLLENPLPGRAAIARPMLVQVDCILQGHSYHAGHEQPTLRTSSSILDEKTFA